MNLEEKLKKQPRKIQYKLPEREANNPSFEMQLRYLPY